MRIALITSMILIATSSMAQSVADSSLLQFSGLFLDKDSLTPVPYVSVVVTNRNQGTTTDYKGTFSFVAYAGDTVRFTCVGYEPFQCVIPDTLKTKRYTLIQLFSRDTVYLPEAVIFPWPSKEHFKDAFMNLYIPDDDMERARKNLAWMEERNKLDGNQTWGSINYKLTNQAYTERLYYSGQYPPIRVFDPFAWVEFFRALKDGDLKNPNKQ